MRLRAAKASRWEGCRAAWDAVDDAQRPGGGAIGTGERRAGVEADVGSAG